MAAPPHHNGPHLVAARAEPSGQSHSPHTQTAPCHIYRLAKCHSPQRPPLTSGLRFPASLEIKVGVGGKTLRFVSAPGELWTVKAVSSP